MREPWREAPKHPRPQRRLLLADSFEGIPQPRTERAKGIDSTATWPDEYRYSAGQARARSTLRRYGMLDDRVVFVPGYFNESLPTAPTRRLALIHIDADACAYAWCQSIETSPRGIFALPAYFRFHICLTCSR